MILKLYPDKKLGFSELLKLSNMRYFHLKHKLESNNYWCQVPWNLKQIISRLFITVIIHPSFLQPLQQNQGLPVKQARYCICVGMFGVQPAQRGTADPSTTQK